MEWLLYSFIILVVGLFVIRIMVKTDILDLEEGGDMAGAFGVLIVASALGPIALGILGLLLFLGTLYRLFKLAVGGNFLPEDLHDKYVEWRESYSRK